VIVHNTIPVLSSAVWDHVSMRPQYSGSLSARAMGSGSLYTVGTAKRSLSRYNAVRAEV
jgi:hypothetical protein